MFGPASPYQNYESAFSLESVEPSQQPASPSKNSAQKDLDKELPDGFQGDLQHPLKKRKLNDGSFQSHTTTLDQTTETPQQPKTASDHTLAIELNFPIISEVDENPTPSHTCTTPFKEDNLSMSLRTSGELKRRILSHDHQKNTPLQTNNRFFSDSKPLGLGNLNRTLNLESFGNLQASLVMDRNIVDNQDDTMQNEGSPTPNKNDWPHERQNLPRSSTMGSQMENEPHIVKAKFDTPAPVNVNTPSKRKIVVPKTKGGSVSVCKFPNADPLNSWTNQKADLKPATPAASEFQFKAKPMPRFVPFEAKKSDRPCVIPEEFHLMTEERGRMKEESLRRKLDEQERMSSITRGFKAGPLPTNRNSFIDGLAQSQAYRATMNPDSREMSEERSRFVSRSVSKDYMEEFASSQHFRALPMPDFSRPFKPKVGVAPLTEVDERVLNTEARAQRRATFENHLREREFARELAKQMEEEEKKRKDKEEIAELRRQMTFRARPYRDSSSIKTGQKERLSRSPGLSSQKSVEKTMQNCE